MDSINLRNDVKHSHYILGRWIETIESQFTASELDHNALLIADSLEAAQKNLDRVLELIQERHD